MDVRLAASSCICVRRTDRNGGALVPLRRAIVAPARRRMPTPRPAAPGTGCPGRTATGTCWMRRYPGDLRLRVHARVQGSTWSRATVSAVVNLATSLTFVGTGLLLRQQPGLRRVACALVLCRFLCTSL